MVVKNEHIRRNIKKFRKCVNNSNININAKSNIDLIAGKEIIMIYH